MVLKLLSDIDVYKYIIIYSIVYEYWHQIYGTDLQHIILMHSNSLILHHIYNNIPGKYWQPSMAMAPSDFCTFKLLPDTDDASTA